MTHGSSFGASDSAAPTGLTLHTVLAHRLNGGLILIASLGFESYYLLSVLRRTMILPYCLIDGHIAGTRMNGDYGAAAAYFTYYALAIFLDTALHGCRYWMAQRDASGT